MRLSAALLCFRITACDKSFEFQCHEKTSVVTSDLCSLATDEHTAQHTLQKHMKVCEAHGQVPRHEGVAVVSPQHKLYGQKKKT